MPNKIKTNPETPLVFQPSGSPFPSGAGIPSGVIINFNPASMLSIGDSRISDRFDLGPGPRTTLFEWRGTVNCPNGAIPGQTVDAYVVTGNSVTRDGLLPIVDSPVTSGDKRRNLQFCGSMQVDSFGTPPDPAQSSGLVEIFGRYISVLWWNNMSGPVGTGSYFILTPVPDEVQ
jgi:hypothetical protein